MFLLKILLHQGKWRGLMVTISGCHSEGPWFKSLLRRNFSREFFISLFGLKDNQRIFSYFIFQWKLDQLVHEEDDKLHKQPNPAVAVTPGGQTRRKPHFLYYENEKIIVFSKSVNQCCWITMCEIRKRSKCKKIKINKIKRFFSTIFLISPKSHFYTAYRSVLPKRSKELLRVGFVWFLTCDVI